MERGSWREVKGKGVEREVGESLAVAGVARPRGDECLFLLDVGAGEEWEGVAG